MLSGAMPPRSPIDAQSIALGSSFHRQLSNSQTMCTALETVLTLPDRCPTPSCTSRGRHRRPALHQRCSGTGAADKKVGPNLAVSGSGMFAVQPGRSATANAGRLAPLRRDPLYTRGRRFKLGQSGIHGNKGRLYLNGFASIGDGAVRRTHAHPADPASTS